MRQQTGMAKTSVLCREVLSPRSPPEAAFFSRCSEIPNRTTIKKTGLPGKGTLALLIASVLALEGKRFRIARRAHVKPSQNRGYLRCAMAMSSSVGVYRTRREKRCWQNEETPKPEAEF